MDLELTSDQTMFVETTRSFLAASCATNDLRVLRDDPAGFDKKYWTQGAELGWTSLLVSEKDGGGSVSGQGVKDLALVAFEYGRFAAPGPLIAVNIVAGALSRSGTDEQKAEILSLLLSGDKVASWAYAEPRPFDAFGQVALEATKDGAGYTLSGFKAPVESAGQSDFFLVVAKDGDGLTQFIVPADAAGISVTPMKSLDLTRRFGKVSFDKVSVPASAVVGEAGAAAEDIERQLHWALVLQLAEMTGAMDRGLEITLEWLFNRYSFGRPLASYQELKHRFVDHRVWLEGGCGIADTAADEVQAESARAGEYVSSGKSFLGEFGPSVLQDCVQMHGGIGITFEHDLHLFLRRVTIDAQTYGTVVDHRERLTSILEGQA